MQINTNDNSTGVQVIAIDYSTGVVTYKIGDMEIPAQEDWDVIPTLRVGDWV